MPWKKEYVPALYWGVFVFIMLLKYSYYQFEYFPVMDDWIQYKTYGIVDNPLTDVILKTQIHTVRPLAAFTDIYIIANLWDSISVVFLVITLMHIASAYFVSRVLLDCGIHTGPVFLLVYGLLPFGTEATYWISASSRIITSMFFTSMALFFLCRYLYHKAGAFYLLFFFISLLISLGYYETVIILGFTALVLILFTEFKTVKGKIATLVALIPYAIISSHYSYFGAEGQLSGRGQLSNPDVTKDHTKTVDAILEMLSKSDIYFYVRGFIRGWKVLTEDGAILFTLLIVFAGVAVYFMCRYSPIEPRIFANVKKFLIGLILFCAPFLLFFLILFNWVSFRNAFTSFIGLALMVEAVLDMLTKNQFLKKTRDVLTAVVAIVFLIVTVSELSDFRRVSMIDSKICAEILKSAEGTGYLTGEKKAILLNAGQSVGELNKYYHEHINSITGSDWALTGALRGLFGNIKLKTVTPFPINKGFLMKPADFEQFVLLGVEDDYGVSLLTLAPVGEHLFALKRMNGEVYGTIEYRWGHAFLSKKNILRNLE